MGLRCCLDDDAHTTGILARIGMKYLGIKTQGRGILACVHLNRDHHVQGPTHQCGTAYAAKRQRLTAERNAE
ncbi:hypothetical protein [Rhodoferax sp.]|uniref:hypothetical protein n=1 Tax=Rhodoferax sp. TaxID=50421 RepID=UPI00271E3523|nr:hypothetical protein [Rhodoferax sp.]MDO9198961.1 hypothetical protein [Rhodoferax sp.]